MSEGAASGPVDAGSTSALRRVAPRGANPGRASAEPGAGEAQLAVEVGARVECRDGHAGRVTRVLTDPNTQRVTHVVVHRGALLGRDLVVPVEWVARAEPDRVLLDVGLSQLASLSEYRPDPEVRRGVEWALWEERLHRAGWPALRVDVRDGLVTLRGHVLDRERRARAETAARRVRGVREVRNRLVADDDLAAAIARALAEDPRTAGKAIQVRASEGIVHLSGAVISAEMQAAVEEVTAAVPGVRGMVCSLLGAEAIRPPSEVMLPAIGTRVFTADGLLGYLEQVVINPRLRAVTHLVVAPGPQPSRHSAPSGASQEPGRLLVPIGLVDRWVKDSEGDDEGEMVLLRIGRAETAWLPEYREEHYVVPGPNWQPPFDYQSEEVRFAAEPETRP